MRDRSRGLSRACLAALVVAGLAAGCATGDRDRAAGADPGATTPAATSGGAGEDGQGEDADREATSGETGTAGEHAESREADGLPGDAVAVVDGAPIPRSTLESWVAQQLLALEAQGKTPPAEGSSEYRAIVARTLIVLVQHKVLELEAKKQRVAVTEGEIDERIREVVEGQFGGSEQRYEESLRRSGATAAQAREEIRSQLLYAKLAKKATEGVTVSDAELRAAYEADKARFTRKRRREVAVILVASRADAEAALGELGRGKSFSSVAKAVSLANAVRYTDSEADFPPEFERVAFSLATGETSEPVQVAALWYVIKAVGDLVPGKTRSFAEVEKQLRRELLDEKRGSDATWFARLMKQYEEKTEYAPDVGSGLPRAG